MIPWKLTTEFDKEHHLFSNAFKTDYVVNSFTCSCGNTDFIIGYLHDEIKYTCPTCDNRTFYDANIAKENIDEFLSDNSKIALNSSFELNICKEYIEAAYVVLIPESIDFMKQKVSFARRKIYNHYRSEYGYFIPKLEIKQNKDLFVELEIDLVNRLKEKLNYLHISTNGCGLTDPSDLLFFLKNKSLKEFDLLYWDRIAYSTLFATTENLTVKKALRILSNLRKEKSVKKVIYDNYCNRQWSKYIRFNSALIESFTQEIEDTNILVNLLQLEFSNTYFGSDGEASNLIKILKHRYTEKQILALFTEYSKYYNPSDHAYFRDMVDAILSIIDIDAFFKIHKKVKCNISSLHDATTSDARKLLRKQLANKKIYNAKHKLKPCVQIDNYEIRLPKNGRELHDWADALHNCMASYYESIVQDETLIYGFFLNNEIEFAVEIIEGSLIQASRTCNQDLLQEQQKVLEKWLKRYFPDEEICDVA